MVIRGSLLLLLEEMGSRVFQTWANGVLLTAKSKICRKRPLGSLSASRVSVCLPGKRNEIYMKTGSNQLCRQTNARKGVLCGGSMVGQDLPKGQTLLVHTGAPSPICAVTQQNCTPDHPSCVHGSGRGPDAQA